MEIRKRSKVQQWHRPKPASEQAEAQPDGTTGSPTGGQVGGPVSGQASGPVVSNTGSGQSSNQNSNQNSGPNSGQNSHQNFNPQPHPDQAGGDSQSGQGGKASRPHAEQGDQSQQSFQQPNQYRQQGQGNQGQGNQTSNRRDGRDGRGRDGRGGDGRDGRGRGGRDGHQGGGGGGNGSGGGGRGSNQPNGQHVNQSNSQQNSQQSGQQNSQQSSNQPRQQQSNSRQGNLNFQGSRNSQGGGGGFGGGGRGGRQQRGDRGPRNDYAQGNQSGINQSGSNQSGTNQMGIGGSSRGGPISTYVDVDGNPLIKPEKFIAFENLTTIDPQPRLSLEYPGCPASCRLIDLFCPIGRGQRGLIVSPPKAGKTTLLKDIATALLRNHPEIEVVVLLIDERPEEVTDFRRTFANVQSTALAMEMVSRGEVAYNEETGEAIETVATGEIVRPKSRCRVIASSNDHTVERHISIALSTIETCKRMVECGKHVVIMLDSLTRLGRAFNQSRRHSNSGRTMTGGLDSKALEVPRQIFGSARNTEEAGSLSIIASCLVDTGSAADQIIFEEFKGSGNMELILDRKISERRIFPAINLAESGTRKEEKLMTEAEVKTVSALRRRLLAMQGPQQVEQLLAALKRYPTNEALVGGG